MIGLYAVNVLRIFGFLLITSSIWLCIEIFHGQAKSESCAVSEQYDATGIVEDITDCVVFFKRNNDFGHNERVLLDLTPYWIMPQKCGKSILCYDGQVFDGSTDSGLPSYHQRISDLKSKINKVEDFFNNACVASKCDVVAAYKGVNEGCSEIGTFFVLVRAYRTEDEKRFYLSSVSEVLADSRVSGCQVEGIVLISQM